MSRNKILVIDVDPVIRSGICSFLVVHGHLVAEAATPQEAQQQFQRFRPDAAILDFCFPNGDALELLQRIKCAQSCVPIIALIGHGATDVALRAIHEGADQFLMKPVDLSLLHALLLRTLTNQRHRQQSSAMRSRTLRECVDPFVGTSTSIGQLKELAQRVLGSESPVLLLGETGSGKGVLANWMHRNGPRSDEPFLDLNCAGLSRELLESELFGHEKGAFTSALNTKPGLLEVADHGTVFLDEIGDMDLQVQPKFLKVLEDGAFRRLGEVRDRAVDFRLISATHQELLELVRQQRFRSDLYFRVNIVTLRVPPLRERVEDIRVLVRYFLARLSQDRGPGEIAIEKPAMDMLQQYSWPGNIRELRNVLERAVLISQNKRLSVHHLYIQGSALISRPQINCMTGTLEQMEQAYINFVLQEEGGSMMRAARRLGIARSSLYAKMKRYEIPSRTVSE